MNQGYDNPTNLNSIEAMLANVRVQLQSLNNVVFSDGEWTRFVEEYLDKPSDNLVEKTRKIHDNFIYDFVFDDGHIQNIYLVDKKNIAVTRCR
jgi:type I restriction enzyme R subunit